MKRHVYSAVVLSTYLRFNLEAWILVDRYVRRWKGFRVQALRASFPFSATITWEAFEQSMMEILNCTGSMR